MSATGGAASAGAGGTNGTDVAGKTADIPPPRCVLWHPPGVTLPGELLKSLCKRNVRMTVCTDPYRAMAHACKLGRAGDEPLVVLLVRPRELPRVADVIAALGKYAPGAACWQYDERSHPALRSVTPEDVRSWAGAAAAASGAPKTEPARAPAVAARAPKPAPDQPPRLRLTGEGRPAARPASNGEPGAASARLLLTDEELSMLLDPNEPAPFGGGGGRG